MSRRPSHKLFRVVVLMGSALGSAACSQVDVGGGAGTTSGSGGAGGAGGATATSSTVASGSSSSGQGGGPIVFDDAGTDADACPICECPGMPCIK